MNAMIIKTAARWILLFGLFCMQVMFSAQANGASLRLVPQVTDLGSLCSASFSGDGKRILTCSGLGPARVWDALTGKQLMAFVGHSAGVRSASFSSDGKRIVTGSFDKTAKVWDALTGKELLTLSGHTHQVFSASFSSNGKRIVTGSQDNTAKVWDAMTGKELLTLSGNTEAVNAASFSGDGTRIVTGSWEIATVWDAHTGKRLLMLYGHTDWIYSANFSGDGTKILTSSGDLTARVWSNLSGKWMKTLRGHTDTVTSASFSRDGKRIVTSSDDMTAKVWDAQTRKEVLTLSGQTSPFPLDRLFRHSKRVQFLRGDKTVKVFDDVTGKEYLTLSGHTDVVNSAFISADGKRIVTSSNDKTAKVWDTLTGEELRTLSGHTDVVYSASFSADSKRVVTGSFDNTAKVWDLETGKELQTLNGHTSYVVATSFSSDGTRILTGSTDTTARVWDARTGKELQTLKGHSSAVFDVSFTSDNQRILTSSNDTGFRIWNGENGRLLYTIYRRAAKGGMLTVSPDGRYDSLEGAEPSLAHFVADTANGPELVEWSQVNTKDYFVPGLQKLINEGKYVPGKIALVDRKLPPEITILSSGATTKFVAKDQGGGIGEVQIYVGREVVKRIPQGTVKIGVPYEVKLDLAPSDLGLPIDVTASSEEGALFSPLQSDRSLDRGSNQSDDRAAEDKSGVRMVGLFIGSENYVLGGLKALNYAGDDAIEMAKAFAILAKGVDVKPEIYVLTDDAGAIARLMELGVTPLLPTRENYEKVLTQIQKTPLSANDILMLYMSGHGVALGKDRNDFVYLTPAASTTDLEAIAAEKTRIGITGEDILGILREARVSKRMLILDTCSAGAVNQLLALSEKSEESDRKVAIATMSRETRSTQILLGSAKDYKSYEDPRFGHGVMTYALLESLRDASLTDGNDKNEIKSGAWFDAAKRRTENLALELGIEQSPLKAGQESFTIGRFGTDQRAQIILPSPKKIIGRIAIANEDFSPNEAFNEALFSALSTSASGKGAGFTMVRSSESPIALQIYGRYAVQGSVVILNIGIQNGKGDNATKTSLPEIRTTKERAVEDARSTIASYLRNI
jgi:WD40 repeat protein